MKVEIDLITPNYEKVLSNWASVGRTFDLAMEALLQSHCHDDTAEERRQHAMEELEQLKGSINMLHLTWRSAYWEKERLARKKEEDNPLTTFRYWNKEENTYKGEPFGCCKKHFMQLHIPSGLYVRKWMLASSEDTPVCKFCEFAAQGAKK